MDSNVQVISIGRAASNTVVINESNVSALHAQITLSEKEMILEDLGSTNGTSVGKVENKINRSNIRHDDTIFLGSIPYLVKDLIGQANPEYPNKKNTPTGAVKPSPNQPSLSKPASQAIASWNPAVVATVAAGCLLLIASLWFWRSGLKSNENQKLVDNSQKQTSNGKQSESNENKAEQSLTKRDESSLNPNGSQIRNSDENKKAKQPVTVLTALSNAELLRRSLYLVVCTDANGETPFRVGTAFAIDSNHLATSASVIKATENLKTTGFPNVKLVNPVTNEHLEMVSSRIHRKYRSANSNARKAQLEHDRILDELGPNPGPEEIDQFKDQLLNTRTRAIKFFELQTTGDVGLITVNQPLEHWLEGEESENALRPKMKLNVVGFSIDNEDGFFDKSAGNQPTTMQCRVKQVSKWTDESFRILEATGSDLQRDNSFAGSPVLNEQGRVVAVYSRPVPNEDENSDVTQLSAFDAPLFLRVRECLEKLP